MMINVRTMVGLIGIYLSGYKEYKSFNDSRFSIQLNICPSYYYLGFVTYMIYIKYNFLISIICSLQIGHLL